MKHSRKQWGAKTSIMQIEMVKNILNQFHFYKLKVNVCKRETAGHFLVFSSLICGDKTR